MRRKLLVWSVCTLVALLLTPPVVATFDLLSEGNVLTVQGPRQETEVRYDLVVSPAQGGSYRVPDYLVITIEPPAPRDYLGRSDVMAVRYTLTERLSVAPQPADAPVGDRNVVVLLDPDSGAALYTASSGTDWRWINDMQWQRVEHRSHDDGWGTTEILLPERTAFSLFHARWNTTFAAKALDRIEDALPVRRADAAAVIDGVPVLGLSMGGTSHGTVAADAPCHLRGTSTMAWFEDEAYQLISELTHWYDGDTGWPLRSACTGTLTHEDGAAGGVVTAYLQRTHLTEQGAALSVNGNHAADGPVEKTQPLVLYPPEDGSFPYSLKDAARALREDPAMDRLHAFLNDGDVGVRWARLSYHEDRAPVGGAPLEIVRRATGEDVVSPTFLAQWEIEYVNDEGDRLFASSERRIHPDETTPPTNRLEGEDHAEEYFSRAVARGLDAELLPLDQIERLAQDAGMRLQHAPGTEIWFEAHTSLNGAAKDPRTDFVYGLRTHTPTSEFTTTRWDAETGALHGHTEASYDYDVPPPESSTQPATMSAAVGRSPLSPVGAVAATMGLSAVAFAILHSAGPMAWLYAKIARPRILDHPRRAAIHEHLRGHPGASLREIQTELDLGWGSAVHHLRLLEQNRFVTSRRSGRHRRYWVAADRSLEEVRREALLAEPTPRHILELYTHDPSLSQAEVARRLGLARSTVHRHVQALRQAGLLERPAGSRHVTATSPDASPRHT